jgi:hypothetical protein
MATPRGPILTQVDQDLASAPRGTELAQGVAQRMKERAPMAMPPTRESGAASTDGVLKMTWGDFKQRHPEWDGDYWAECRALYAGGARLLRDPKVLERLFPSHSNEDQRIYKQRKDRAHYYPYAGTIIDHLLAGLGTDPLRVSFDEVDKETGVRTLPDDAEWWAKWVTDVTDSAERPADYGLEATGEDDDEDDEGGTTLHHFNVDVLREALQVRTAWVLADLPADDDETRAPRDPDDPLPDPYLCLVPAEQVIDWQTNARGELQWCIVMTQEQIRATPKDRRGKVRHTFVMWDAEAWAKYEIDVDPNVPISDETVVPLVGTGAHGFKRVPFERLTLPEGMHAMGKLHSLAREHFNKRCAMSWAEYKALFAVLYEFLGPEDKGGLPTATAQNDSNRAVNQLRGQGYTQVRGGDDRAEYIGPDTAPFEQARESCNDAMREMHRVMFSMALSVDMDSAAKSQSGESKSQDAASTAVLLDALGTLIRKFMRRLLVLASLGRGEAVPPCRTEGLEQFDVAGVEDAIAQAVEFFNGIPQLSPTVKELALAKVYARYLGDLDPDDITKVRAEIKDGIKAEEDAAAMMLVPPGATGPGGKPPAPGKPPIAAGGGAAKPPAPRAAKPKGPRPPSGVKTTPRKPR